MAKQIRYDVCAKVVARCDWRQAGPAATANAGTSRAGTRLIRFISAQGGVLVKGSAGPVKDFSGYGSPVVSRKRLKWLGRGRGNSWCRWDHSAGKFATPMPRSP